MKRTSSNVEHAYWGFNHQASEGINDSICKPHT